MDCRSDCDDGCVYCVCAGLTWFKVQKSGNEAVAAHVCLIKWFANALAYFFAHVRDSFSMEITYGSTLCTQIDMGSPRIHACMDGLNYYEVEVYERYNFKF